MTKDSVNKIDFSKITTMTKSGKFDPTQFGQMIGGQSYSDIAWFSNAIQTMSNGSDEQKITTATNMFNKVLSIFSDLTTDSTANANQELDTKKQAIDNNNKQAENTFKTVNDKLQSILSKCDGCKANIESAISEIEKLGGDSGEIAKAQAQLEEKLAIIEEQKKILNTQPKEGEDPQEVSKRRKNAIDTILSTVSGIYTLSDSVSSYKTELEKQTEIVNTSAGEVDGFATQLQGIVADGVNNTQTALGTITQLNVETAAEQTESGAKTVLGTSQTTAAAAPQNIATGLSEQLIASGTDKISAGAKLMKGAIEHFQLLGQSQQQISAGLNDFVNFSQGIGQYSNGILELAGGYNTTASDMISSVGTWVETVNEANKGLEEYTTQYASEIGYDTSNTEDSENKEIRYKEFEFDTKEMFKIEKK